MEPRTNVSMHSFNGGGRTVFTVLTVAMSGVASYKRPKAATVQSLPPTDLDHRGHHLRIHQTAAHLVVPSHLPDDPGQERDLGNEAAPPSGNFLQRGVAHAPQADAGDDGARPAVSAHRPGSNSMMPTSVASAVRASGVAVHRRL